MAIEVFNRYEKKYIISDEVFRKLKPMFEEYMEADEHSRSGGSYTICNIYYDSENDEIVRKSIEKPVYKEKLRLRSYGVAGPADQVFLELKKKFKGCVNKRRTPILLKEAYEYFETGQKPEIKNKISKNIINQQVLNEIDFMLRKYPTLQPKLFLSYDRIAMFGIENRSFRITFDRNILTRRYDLGLDIGIYGEPLLPADQWIMEVKSENAIPLWLAELLSEYKIYPVSFSKYGMEYQKTIRQNMESCPELRKLCV